ncbi:hypothetical protein PENTCL1PPCAC_30822, partial [Pristionchus entomophagus]
QEDHWAHARTHIPPDRQLSCTFCNFLTDLPYHLDYHLRIHAGAKPFQCKKCDYRCVNQSQLNAHMKSHSAVYKHRYADCNYSTKYSHSLQLHLDKYSHRRNNDDVSEDDLLARMTIQPDP